MNYDLVFVPNIQQQKNMLREALDNSNFACGIFIDLQEPFGTVDHQILLNKMEYYRVRGLANK